MTEKELKTLKDIEIKIDNPLVMDHTLNTIDRIRAEAMKWAKEGQQEEEDALEIGQIKFYQGWQEALERFFNLTEDDLK